MSKVYSQHKQEINSLVKYLALWICAWQLFYEENTQNIQTY